MRQFALAAATACLLLSGTVPGSVLAQEAYPSHPIHVIIPVPPGSGVDLIMRKMGQALLPTLGQNLVVENRLGANFMMGPAACAKAAPDGYTWCVVSSLPIAFDPEVFRHMPYDAQKDFDPVINMFYLLEGWFARASLPVNSIAQLRRYAVAHPGKLNFGTLGPNSTTDISRRYLEKKWHTKIAGIPYKGGPLILRALASGEIDMARIGAYNGLGLIHAHKVKLLAIAGNHRQPSLPGVPTIKEAGVADVPPHATWWGIMVPHGTPQAIVLRVNAEIRHLYAEPKFIKFLQSELVEPATGTPSDLARVIQQDREEAKRLVREFHIPKQ